MHFLLTLKVLSTLLTMISFGKIKENRGLSSRLIKILRSIYSKAKIKKADNLDYSEFIESTIGVLQGEILSPLLLLI